MALDSFGQSLPYLPTWFEDETLYSWAARFHELQGRCSEKQTGLTLFGRCHAAKLHEIPTGIAHFVALTRGKLGTLPEIVQQRTVLCELRPFLPMAAWALLLDRFLDDDKVANTRVVIGLTAGGMGNVRPLRYCAECVKLERAELSTSYWHLQHQLHGSIICLRHHRPLELRAHHRSIWSLPHHRSRMQSAPTITDKMIPSALLLSRLTSMCSQLSEIHAPSFADAATHSLLELGVATSIPRLSGEALSSWFIQTQTRNAAVAYYPKQPNLHSGDWILRLLRARRSGHPIHWLLLWSAILENLPEDLALRRFSIAASGQMLQANQSELWPELSGKRLFTIPNRQAQIIIESSTIHEAAVRLGLTQGTVKRWLVLDETLNFQWRMKQKIDRQSLAVKRVEEIINLNRQISRSDLLKKCKSDMSWLSAHAQPLFSDLLSRIPTFRKGQETLNFPFEDLAPV